MKMPWQAAITAVLLCCGTGLLYAQNAVPPQRSVWSGVYSIAQAQRGQAFYGQVCQDCHGEQLEGDDSEGVTPLAGDHFMINWDMQTVADLVTRIHAQPNDEPEDIDTKTRTDLVAFILAFNRIPAGPADLSGDRSTEAAIQITAQPPAGIVPNPTP